MSTEEKLLTEYYAALHAHTRFHGNKAAAAARALGIDRAEYYRTSVPRQNTLQKVRKAALRWHDRRLALAADRLLAHFWCASASFPYLEIEDALAITSPEFTVDELADGHLMSTRMSDDGVLQLCVAHNLLLAGLVSDSLMERAIASRHGLRTSFRSPYLTHIEFALDDDDSLGTISDDGVENERSFFQATEALVQIARTGRPTSAFQYLCEVLDLRSDGYVVPQSTREAAHFAVWAFVTNSAILASTEVILHSAAANPRLEEEPLTVLANDLFRKAWLGQTERLSLCERFVGELAQFDLTSAERASRNFQFGLYRYPTHRIDARAKD